MPTIVRCPHCSQGYSVDERLFGRSVKCKSCGQEFRVPKPESPAAPAQPTPPTLPVQASRGLGDLLDDPLAGLDAGAGPSPLGPLAGGPALGPPIRAKRRRRVASGITATDQVVGLLGKGMFAVSGFIIGFAAFANLMDTWLSPAAAGVSLVALALFGYSIRRNRLKLAGVSALGALVVAMLAVALVLGWKGNAAGKRFDQLTDQVLADLSEIADAFAGVRDVRSAMAAREKVDALIEEIVSALEERERLDQQGVVPADQQKVAEFPARLQQIGVKLHDALRAAKDPSDDDLRKERDLLGVRSYNPPWGQMGFLSLKADKVIGEILRWRPVEQGVVKRPKFSEELYSQIHSFHGAYDGQRRFGKGAPRSWEDLLAYVESRPDELAKIQQWRATGPVVVWGIEERDVRLTPGEWILAYRHGDRDSMGYCVMFDGGSKYVTAREFQDLLLRMTLAWVELTREEVQAWVARRTAAPKIAEAPTPPRKNPVVQKQAPGYATGKKGPAFPAELAGPGFSPAGAMRGAGPGTRGPTVPGPRIPGRGFSPGGMMRPTLDVPQPGDTELVGGTGGNRFRKAQPGSLLLGLRYSLGNWAGTQALGSAEPVFRREEAGPSQAALAKEGYAVGAMNVDADQLVLAVQLVFMRVGPEGRLDSNDTYTSPWLGKPSGRPSKTVTGNGKKVIGICGRGAAVVDAIGLVTE